jgi:hypothetical protein
MSYYILFWGPWTVLRASFAVMKTRGLGPFSQLYELLRTVSGSVDSFTGISGIYQNSWIWSFPIVIWAIAYSFGVLRQFWGHFWHLSKLVDLVVSVVIWAIAYCLGSVDSFEGISGSRENSWIGSFLAFIWAIAYCFGVRRQFQGHFWHLSKLMDWVLSHSYMSYCILFWGPSTISRAFLAFIKTRGFGPFS